MPHEYNKRVVKPAKFKRSPFIDYENKKQFMVSRVINEVYDDICKNGGRTKLRRNRYNLIFFVVHSTFLLFSKMIFVELTSLLREVKLPS